MAESKIIFERLYSRVETAMKKPENKKKLYTYMGSCIDRNTSKLNDVGPLEMVYFSGKDINIIFECCGITEAEVATVVKEVKTKTNIQAQWSVVGKPFYILLALVIRYFTIAKDDGMVKVLLLFYGISLYPSLFFKYFQHPPVQNIMEYTINNLSNKYKIKQIGTMYGTIIHSMTTAHETGTKALISCTDKELLIYIQDKKTRLNDIFKNIAREYYQNHEDKKYLNYDFDNFEDEGFHESKSNMFEINRITEKVVMQLVVNGPDMKIVNVSAKINQVSVNELRNYVNVLIVSENREDIRKLVEYILSLYLFDANNNPNEIRSDKFLSYCLEVYKKSNTNNRNIIDIKAILDKWLKDVGLLEKTNRPATVNSFRKALYTFFVFTIEKNN